MKIMTWRSTDYYKFLIMAAFLYPAQSSRSKANNRLDHTVGWYQDLQLLLKNEASGQEQTLIKINKLCNTGTTLNEIL
jgi:hypothetical protein